MNRYGVFSFLLLLLLVACGESHEQMLRQLEELERMNRADSVMLNDTLAKQLVQYFDRHGDSNERMRAHYILGRTYADMGEAPAALGAYLDAADCADTTATYCDYHTLSRVYGQMAKVFYWQNLMDDFLVTCDRAIDYAWRDNDTMQALNVEAHKISAYNHLKQYDKVIADFDYLFNQLYLTYGIGTAAKYCILPINALLEKGELEKANYYIDILEKESLYFDSKGNIEKGREVCYYYIGMYYLKTQQLDSAEYYFRKELQLGMDADNQQMASWGLSHLFYQSHTLDSAIKYSFYNYDMLDSVFSRKAIVEVKRMSALHNYTRHQEIANREHLRANFEKLQKDRLYIVLFFILVIVGCAWFLISRKRRKSLENYSRKVRELAETSRMLQDLKKQKSFLESLTMASDEKIKQKTLELAIIQQQNNALIQQIDEANNTLVQLRKELMKRHEETILSSKEVDAHLQEIPIYQQLQSKSMGHEALTANDWLSIEKLVKTELPGFYNLITSRQSSLRTEGRRLCFLLRLHVGLKEAATMMNTSQSKISKLSRNTLLHVFQEDGSGKELIKRLQDFF